MRPPAPSPSVIELPATAVVASRAPAGAPRVGAWEWDLASDHIDRTPACCALFGRSQADFPSDVRGLVALLHPGDQAAVMHALTRALTGEAPYDALYRIALPEGGERWLADCADMFFDEQGRPERLVGVITDVTASVQRERRALETNDGLHRALYESTHRIKNHLQMLAAMVDIQVMAGSEDVPREAVRKIAAQIRALAAVHDLLTHDVRRAGPSGVVSARDLLEKLVAVLEQTAGGAVLPSLDDARLDVRKLAALSLVLNELVSNAVKHGSPPVEVAFRADAATGVLEVCDTGPGFPDGFAPTRAASVGLDLVHHLVSIDLRGRIAFANRSEGGARVTVAFPL